MSILTFTGPVQAQTNELSALKERLAQAIIERLTPEMLAYYEQQKQLFKRNHPLTPFVSYGHHTAYEPLLTRGLIPPPGPVTINRVLLIVNQTLYANTTAKGVIDRYAQDIGSGHGCTVEVELTQGGSPSDIKNLIKQYYNNGGLDGVVLIGDHPVQWYDIQAPRFDPGSFACDLYYMDLDGTWEQLNAQNEYTWHRDGSGDIMPEVFVSRIHLTSMSDFGSEVTLLQTFLNKSHLYWTGGIPLYQHGKAFIQETWEPWSHLNTLHNLYGSANTDLLCSQTSANSTAYINDGLLGSNGFVHLWCHSDVHGHSFDWGGSISDVQLYSIASKPIGYAIDACHIGAWPEGGGSCISGSYVFGSSPNALIILSGTRSGQSIGSDGEVFFSEMGDNVCFGKAFRVWMDAYFGQIKGTDDHVDDYETKPWNYGYVLIGDPMVAFKSVPSSGTAVKAVSPAVPAAFNMSVKGSQVLYRVPASCEITLGIYDLKGTLMHSLYKGYRKAGSYRIDLNGNRLAKGLYLCRMKIGGFNKAILFKSM